MAGGTVASKAINPTTFNRGNPVTKGHVDPNTNSTAILTAGVRGAFFTLADTASLIGKMAYQVPASLLTTQTNPAAQTGMQIAALIQQEADKSRMSINMGGAMIQGLSSLIQPNEEKQAKKEAKRLAKAEWKNKGADIS